MHAHNFKKQYGQNFLTNIPAIIKFVDCSGVVAGDNVIEIGPGDGALTDILLQTGCKLTCIEIDFDLIESLQQKYTDFDNFSVVNADILQFDISTIVAGHEYKVVSALPYNISKQIIKVFLELEHAPTSMTFIMQNEVAKKYTSRPPKSDFLSSYASVYANASYEFAIAKEQFYPMPKVDGGVVTFTDIAPKYSDTVKLVKFIHHGYSNPRKKLSTVLQSAIKSKTEIEEYLSLTLNLSTMARAGELNLSQWNKLYEFMRHG